ncbi:MAG: AAA family ATPase [Pseudomonadota bacterium]
MDDPDGFVNLEKVYESKTIRLLRAIRRADNVSTILKVFQGPAYGEGRHFDDVTEFFPSQIPQIPGVARILEPAIIGNGLALVIEDPGGTFLKALIGTNALRLEDILALGIRTVDILRTIHASKIIHSAVSPFNILYDETRDKITILPTIATCFPQEQSLSTYAGSEPEGPVDYISPEQTGRTNLVPDYRSDYYSLGIVLYEMLVGTSPFASPDSLGTIHGHLARSPASPAHLNAEIPQAVSDLVVKLLSKDREDRYQSSRGIRRDLEKCLQELRTVGRISFFQVAREDVPEQFRVPDKLYGRKSELRVLHKAFDRARNGHRELVTVLGSAGSGKTSLVSAMRQRVAEGGGQFVSGKFRRHGEGIPYDAFIQAFTEVVQRILTRNDDEISWWKGKLLDALGANGRVIISLIPKLEFIIGPQPPLPEVGPLEAQHRFDLVLQSFVRALCTSDQPLCLFLDDCQWADMASLRIVQWLTGDEHIRHILIVFAFRDTEVDSTHPVTHTLKALNEGGLSIGSIALTPLSRAEIGEIVLDTFRMEGEQPALLEEVIRTNTAGNPLFVKEYLRSLHLEDYFAFDPAEGIWSWDLDRIKAREVNAGVVDLLSRRIVQLPAETRELVKTASCLGNRFEINWLAAGCGKTAREILTGLMPAMEQGLVVHVGSAVRRFESKGSLPRDDQRHEIRFVHDRIQQAAYELVPDSEKPLIHKRIGESLIPLLDLPELDSDVFLVTDQLNAAVDLMETPSERLDLARRNLLAGTKAKNDAAHASAFDYLLIGISLLGPDGWKAGYELCLNLHLEAAEAAWLSGRFDEAANLTDTVVRHAQSLLDRVKAEEIAIQASFAKGDLREAVDRGRAVLKELGVDLPRNPSQARVLERSIAVFILLLSTGIDGLLKLPTIHDPLILASMRVMSGVGTAVYFSAPDLVPLLMLEQALISLKHGKAPSSAFVYVCLGFIMCSSLGMIQKGYRLGTLGVTLALEPGNERYAGRTIYVFNSLVRHWKDHIREASRGMLEALDRARQSGDFEYVALGLNGYGLASYIAGEALDKLVEEMSEGIREIRRLQQDPHLQAVEMHYQAALNLMDVGSANPAVLKGNSYDEDERIALYLESNDLDSLFHVYSLKMCLNYLFGDCPQALVYADKARPHVDAALGAMQVPVFYFYEALTALGMFGHAARLRRPVLMKIVRANRRKLRKWARHAPMNYLHKYYLVEAERLRVLGRHSEAVKHYDAAVESAGANQYVQEEGLAHELLGRFMLHSGDRDKAEEHIRRAISCYAGWGAQAKVADVERRYARLLGPERDDSRAIRADISQPLASEYKGALIGPEEEALAKALQAVSGEIVLENLIHKLMRVVTEVGGAQKGLLVLESRGELFVEAEVGPGRDDIVVLKSLPVQEISAGPAQVINYVSRTMELITLDDTSKDDLFRLDFKWDGTVPKSILCAPLIHQGRLVGLLYLENRLTAGAFSSDRTTVLRFLCSQAAVLIENARMYVQLEDHSRHLEQKVRERTEEYERAVTSLKKEVREKEQVQGSLERALSAAAILRNEAEAASAAKTDFLTNMSHELRTPLNAIIGFSELLEDQIPGRLNEKQLKYVRHVFNSGHHLLQLINDILDLAKVEAGKMELRPASVDLGQLLNNTSLMMRQKAFKHGLKLGVHVSDDLEGHRIQADDVKLKQIVFNLLSNAVKFTPDGGRIDLSAKREGVMVVIGVTDTGIGIRPEDQGRIFDAFEQVDSTHRRRFEGTGLGLALTRRLAELHGGTIGVESQGEHKGSTFTVSIPYVPAESEEETSEASYDQETGGVVSARVIKDEHRPRVLVIEDNEANMKLATSLLEAGGYRPLQAWNAEEGIESARSERPELILMDIALPGMDGLTATKILKSDPATAEIPVVAVTAHAMKGDEEKAREAGCDGYLTKPVQTDAFYGILGRCIGVGPLGEHGALASRRGGDK